MYLFQCTYPFLQPISKRVDIVPGHQTLASWKIAYWNEGAIPSAPMVKWSVNGECCYGNILYMTVYSCRCTRMDIGNKGKLWVVHIHDCLPLVTMETFNVS